MLALLKDLWNDKRGFVVTAELALLATLGVVGATVGLYSAGNAVDRELRDVARAFRSLDQSYSVQGFRGCGAATAGSAYTQPPVKRSLKKLERDERDFERGERRDGERDRRRRRRERDERPAR
ncbi:MAG: hypothetical protein ACE5KM_21515 [Planctomycetaceae bacterium]